MSKTSISGVLWGNRQRATVTHEEVKGTKEQQDDRRAADMLARGIARSRRDSNGEGFGE